MKEKKTLQEWMAYFHSPDRQYTRDEFEIMMEYHARQYLSNIMKHLEDQQRAILHIEAMLTRLDTLIGERVVAQAALTAGEPDGSA